MSILDKNLESVISKYYTDFLDGTFESGPDALSVISNNDIAFVVNNAIPADKAIIFIKQLVDDYNEFKTGVDTRFEQQAEGIAIEIENATRSIGEHLIENVEQAVQAEASARDEAINQAIQSEESSRDSAIEQAIQSEESSRDEAINQAIQSEESARTYAIETAKTNINLRIDNEISRMNGRIETYVAPKVEAVENAVNGLGDRVFITEQNIRELENRVQGIDDRLLLNEQNLTETQETVSELQSIDTQLSAKIQEFEAYKVATDQTLARCFEKIQELENTVIALSALITPTDVEIILNYNDNTGTHAISLQANDTIAWSTSTGNYTEYVKNINF